MSTSQTINRFITVILFLAALMLLRKPVFGQGIAAALAQAGADVVGISCNAMPDTGRLVTDHGRRFAGIQADCTGIDDGTPLIEQAAKAFGRLDILVLNHGTTHRQPAKQCQ